MKILLIILLLLLSLTGFSQSRIILNNNARMVISGNAFLVVDNPSPNAVTDQSANCGIISEGENNRIRWNIGTATGNYSLPFFDNDNAIRIPVSFNLTAAGTGSGYIDFSTYDGSTWDNNTYRPSMVTHTQLYFPPSTTNNSDKMIDRFWLLNAQGYTTKPSGDITFTYIDAEHSAAGNTINETLLSAKRFNSGSAVWSDMLNSGTAITGANTVTTGTIAPNNLFAAWTLIDPSCNIGGTTAGSNGPVCDGNALNLNASGGTSYSWTGPSGFTSSQQNPVINPADPSASGTYTVIITNDYNCKDTLTVTVVVNTITADAGIDQSIFNGQSTNLGATGSGGSGNYSYSWSPAVSLVDASVQNPQTVNLTSTTTFTVTVTDVTTGCTDTDVMVVTITGAVLSANADANPDTVCQGTPIQLYANAGGGSGTYTYTWASSPAGFSSASASPTDTPLQTTTYSVTVDDGVGTVTSTVTVVVLSVPAVSAGSNSPVCEGKDIELTASGASVHSWTGPGGYTASIQNPVISPALPSNAGVYTVVITDDLGCTAAASVTVVINPAPVISASSNTPVCEGSDLNLFISGGDSWNWTGPDSYTSSDQNPVISPAALTHAGTYTVVASSSFGCTSSTTTDVVINATPDVTASSNSPICEGSDINLTSNGGVTWSWTGPNSFTSTQQNPVIPSATSANAGTYTVVGYSAEGCTDTATTVVTTGGNITVTPTANSPLCEGETLTLNASGGTSYDWSGPGGWTASGASHQITSVTSAMAGTYSVTVSDAFGCSGTGSVAVVINALPSGTADNNGPLCEGDALLLTASGGTGYSWSGPDSFTSTLSNPSISPVSIAHAGTYSVTVTASGCSVVVTTTVVINASPTVNASSNSPLCEGETLNLSSLGGGTYAWSGPGGFSSTEQNPSVDSVLQADGGTYTVTVTGTGGCTGSQSVTVIVETTPVASCDNNNPACPGDPLMLIASGGTAYAWSGPGGFASTEQNPVITNATSSASGTYFVIVSSAAGCTASAQTTVTYPQPIVISGVVSQNATDHMGSIDITASGGQLPYSYQWSNGATSEDVTGLFSGTYMVLLTDAGNCQAADTFVVDIPLIIPNAITPNDDAINDDFEIINIGAYKEVTLEIYNRWGDLLFRFEGSGAEYAMPEKRWDGTHNGKALPMGSYLYILSLDEMDPLTGAVMLKY